jgi:superfamily II DNA or RNA helicase
VSNSRRNQYICELVKSRPGTTLVLFRYIEKHGLVLKDMMQDLGKPVYYVSGMVKAEIREEIRQIVSNSDNSVILASLGTFAIGVNIKNIDSIVFTHPSKSKIQIFQSIGRSLRTTETKFNADLYDLVDDLSIKNHKNHTLKHFFERMKMYIQEQFQYEISTHEF